MTDHNHPFVWRVLFWPVVLEDDFGHGVAYIIIPGGVLLTTMGIVTPMQALFVYLGLGLAVALDS